MIDEQRLKENLTIFSFSRLSRKDVEKKALNIACSKVEGLDHDPLSQAFVFSTFLGIGKGNMESFEYIHSTRDTENKVDISLLKNLYEMIIDSLLVFANQI